MPGRSRAPGLIPAAPVHAPALRAGLPVSRAGLPGTGPDAGRLPLKSQVLVCI